MPNQPEYHKRRRGDNKQTNIETGHDTRGGYDETYVYKHTGPDQIHTGCKSHESGQTTFLTLTPPQKDIAALSYKSQPNQ